MELSLQSILKTFVILYGNSGAGKGDTIAKISELCRQRDIGLRTYASGDGFRGLSSIPEPSQDVIDALSLMKAGLQAEGLWPIAGSAIAKIKEHILDLADNKRSLLCLDGMWRNGEDLSKLTPDVRLPSQGLQLSGMILTAVKQLIDEGKIKLSAEDSLLVGGTDEQDLKTISEDGHAISKIRELLIKDANKIIVHVSEGDAKDLMRNRSFKELQKLFMRLVVSDDGSEKSRKLLESVRDLMLLQSGNYYLDGNREIMFTAERLDDPKKPFEAINPTALPVVDAKVKSICREILPLFVPRVEIDEVVKKGGEIGRYIKIFKNLNIPTELRADDMDSKVVDERTGQFRINVEGKVYAELGVSVDNGDKAEPRLIRRGLVNNVILICNGIDRENPAKGYERFMSNVEGVQSIFERDKNSVEGDLIGERRRV